MSEKLFHMNFDKYAHQIMCNGEGLSLQETVKILNEQQSMTNKLTSQLQGLCNDFEKVVSENSVLRKNNNQLQKENEHLRKRVKAISDELYCKDRKLEELGVPIECCDKMSEKRFVIDEEGISDNKTDNWYCWKEEVVDLLNEQQDTIITLKRRLEKINGGYGLLTHRKGLTANEWVIESQERELKKKNEQISNWIEQHSKDIVKIGEQQATIKSKDKQLERLYNYFQDYLKDEMSGNAFSEMWDFVKEDEKWEDE